MRLLKSFDVGVLECWSDGVLKDNIKLSASTPTLHYSNTPKFKKFSAPRWIIFLGVIEP
ncbi:hypothetical protein D1AOALGA4SA_4811 [Olavius algarvensis Delta 1 endosymbiont]|nr:hypothetical protein D1AOALGA4SA_4811 [Olavius algarvensis Delta 1 endosymbiont]